MKTAQPAIMRLSLTACGLWGALLFLALVVGQTQPAERIVFMSDNDGPLKLYGLDIRRGLYHKLNNVEISWTYALSPDGQRVLYMRTVDNQPGIFTMDLDGQNSRQLVDEHGINPAWSPDSQSITFTMLGAKNQTTQIYRVRTDGTDLRALTELPAHEQPFASIWSPDGTQILFQVIAARNEVRSYFMNPDGGDIRRLTYPIKFGGIAYPQWSPDSTHVAFVGIAVGSENQAATGVLCVAKIRAIVSSCSDTFISGHLSWSPDSRHIAFISSNGYNIYEVYVFDVETGETRRVLRYGEKAGISGVFFPIWTADGQRLIYEVLNVGTSLRGTQLHIINLDGSGERNLTGGLITSVLPSWWVGDQP